MNKLKSALLIPTGVVALVMSPVLGHWWYILLALLVDVNAAIISGLLLGLCVGFLGLLAVGVGITD